ncbi:MAG: hypothetical protein IJV31_08105 [Clostridia bacterium]|nr:hypothetical protein [Clostridia bacterium]
MAYKSKKQERFEEIVELANTSDEELKNMSYKEKQKVYNAKNKLGKITWNSKAQGQFINYEKQKLKEQRRKKKCQKENM